MADSTHNMKLDTRKRAGDRPSRRISMYEDGLIPPLIDLALPDIMLLYDHNGRLFKVNARACASLGYTRDELCTMRLNDIVQDFDLAAAQAIWSRLESGLSISMNGHHRRKDGSVFPMEMHVGVIEKDGERLYIATVRNVSERQQNEGALHQDEDKYRALFDNTEHGFMLIKPMFDADGRVNDVRYLLVNPAFEKQTGLRAAEFMGKRLKEVLPKIEAHWLNVYDRVARSGRSVRVEEYDKHTERWYEVVAFPHHDDLLGVQFVDITGRMRLERHQAMLLEVSQDLVGLSTIAETMERLGEKIGRYFGAAWCMFGEITEDLEYAVASYGWNDPGVPVLEGQYRMRDFFSDEQFARHNAGELTIVSDTQTDPAVYADSFNALGIRSFVIVPISRDGKWRFLLTIIDIKPRKWSDDDVALLREITERIWTRVERGRVEEALRASEERFQALVKASSDVVYQMSSDWKVMRQLVGRNFIADTERPNETWLQKYIHPQDQDFVLANIEKAIQSRGVFELEHRVLRVDGSLGWTYSRAIPVLDENGDIRSWFGMASDITERKQAEAALQESQLRLNEAQRVAHIGSWEWQSTTDKIIVSDELYHIFGLSSGQAFPDFKDLGGVVFPRNTWKKLNTAVEESMRSGCGYDMEIPALRNGEQIWVHTRSEVLNDADGRHTGLRGTVQDITERKHYEEKVQQHSRLMQSLHRQQVAVQTAAAFAHELNQPLLSIAAYSELALRVLHNDREKADQLARAIEGSNAQALRAGRVLHDLIDHLHKDGGEFEASPFSINELVRDVINKIRKEEFREFQVVLDLAHDLLPVFGNRIQTEKVLHNLIQNGIEAMEEGGMGKDSLVFTLRSRADNTMAHVMVCDNGPGLDTDAVQTVFDPFFTTKPNGLGLGLAISRALIEAQGGQLWVNPEEGPGAVFHLTFPFAHG